MNIYRQKQRWKWWLAGVAMFIVLASLWYSREIVSKIANEERVKVKLWADAVQKKASMVKTTHALFNKMKVEERKKVELYASATRELSREIPDLSFALQVLQNNTTVPVIMMSNDGQITGFRNLDSLRTQDSAYLFSMLLEMKRTYPPIEFIYAPGKKNVLYYKDSKVFSEIKLVFDSLVNSFMDEVAINSASVPVIYTDSSKENVLKSGMIDSTVLHNKVLLKETIQRMEAGAPPLLVDLGEGEKRYIFYEESNTLTILRYYPYIQLLIIGLFLIIAYILFSTARKGEQNMVWVGMSKETAHQLGTPLSSLMAWMEHLKEMNLNHDFLSEINRDILRLQTITDRFSKIGSQPALHNEDIANVVDESMQYLQRRLSKNIHFTFRNNLEGAVMVPLCRPLFEWVIENLTKNAIDAMDGKGNITCQIRKGERGDIVLDIIDNGKGIPRSKLKTVFEPGYTTKARGWGMGLSLCKRIIEQYHSGKIFVKESDLEKGTCFRIILPSRHQQ